jgi:hypothetical protein
VAPCAVLALVLEEVVAGVERDLQPRVAVAGQEPLVRPDPVLDLGDPQPLLERLVVVRRPHRLALRLDAQVDVEPVDAVGVEARADRQRHDARQRQEARDVRAAGAQGRAHRPRGAARSSSSV